MTLYFRNSPTPGNKVNIPGHWKGRATGGSIVQGLEEQPGDLGSDFGLPQTLYMNQEDKMGTHRGPRAFVSKRCPSLVSPKHQDTYRRETGGEAQHI